MKPVEGTGGAIGSMPAEFVMEFVTRTPIEASVSLKYTTDFCFHPYP